MAKKRKKAKTGPKGYGKTRGTGRRRTIDTAVARAQGINKKKKRR